MGGNFSKADARDCSGLRQRLLDWRAGCGWTAEQISGAMHAACSGDHVPAGTIDRFCRVDVPLKPPAAGVIARFLDAWPDPGPYAEWKAALARLARIRQADEDEALARRLDARDAERAAYVRRCLAAEKPRLRSPYPAGVIRHPEARA